jgi:hypothetical protein
VIATAALIMGFADAEGIAIARRLTAAIKGEAAFQESDFAHPLGAADKAALRQFRQCKVGGITYMLTADPEDKDTCSLNPNDVLVQFGCKGVSEQTPVGVMLQLSGRKIEQVETHNADLMRAH